jgi:hypothetical protein
MWPSIEDMAADLDESVNALLRARAAGQLPDPRHDRILILRDRSHGGRLTKAKLDEVRGTRHDVDRAMRGDTIRSFYEACGGVKVVSARTGTSIDHLHANSTRGYLNRTAEAAYLEMAAEVGVELPAEIFTPPKG